MDDYFQQIRRGTTLPSQSVRQLAELGFVTIPGTASGDQLNQLTAAYDEVMVAASGAKVSIGSTTTRLLDLLNRGSVFDRIYLFPPLLEACGHSIGGPFKRSSFLMRSLRAGTPAQELHAAALTMRP